MQRQIAVDHEDRVVVRLTDDVEPLLEYTKAMHNEGLHGSSDMKLAGSIPNILIEDYCNRMGITYEEWSQNPEHIRRVVNDPALSHFRIWKGRV